MQEQASVVIVAAGTSRRMQGRDKIWMPLAGRTTIARTLDVFQSSELIQHIVLVTSSERLADASALWQQGEWSKVSAVVVGGARRQDSVCAGLDVLAEVVPQCRWVMIHDAARPFVTQTILEAGMQAVQVYRAAVAAIPVSDTIKQVQQGMITATLDRSQLWSIQTPQIFAFPLIHQAHHTPLAQEDVTDDATLLERLGYRVAVFAGSPSNFKITTQEDILLAEALLQR